MTSRMLLVTAGSAIVSILSLAPLTSQAAQPVTACGMDINGDAYLEGDLDCTGVSAPGINLHGMATLELRGFSIRNVPNIAVQCFGPCSIVGPGTISDSFAGIRAPYRLRMKNVSIHGMTGVSGTGGSAVEAGTARVENCRIEGGGSGIYAGRKLLLRGSTITGANEFGVHAGFDPFGNREKACNAGIVALVDSDVSGNMLDPDPLHAADNADLVSCAAPKLKGTSTCGTSRQYESTLSWNVCSQD